MLPVSFYGLKVPPGGVLIAANPGVPANIHITMASIDPNEGAEYGNDKPFVTLRIIRDPLDVLDDEDDEDDEIEDDDVEAIRRRIGLDDLDEEEDDDEEDDDEDDEDDDEDEEMVNGGPSDPEKVRKAHETAFQKSLKDDEDDEDEALLKAYFAKGSGEMPDKGKGKALAIDQDDSDTSIDLESSSFVVCTLDASKNLQQPLDITLQDEEVCYFSVVGNRCVHLTGNFVIREHTGDSDDEEEDEEEDLIDEGGIYGPDGMYDSEDSNLEIDELDDIAEPRITELLEDDEAVPKLVKVTKSKGKRAAGELDSDEVDAVLDKLLDTKQAKDSKGELKSKHQAKKLKNNEGQAITGSQVTNGESKKDAKAKTTAIPAEKKAAAVNGIAKKVQFAEKLEQGPTPSASASKRVVKGVSIDDRKPGNGQAAKKGDKVAMRYIGKLKDGKVFDANKKGKPFAFKLGTGEVIKGWDIGVDGMRVGGERRIIVPANLAYGSKAMPGIPGNSELTFDIKMLSIN